MFPEQKYQMFFVNQKNGGLFATAVLDMPWIQDLHAYTLPEHRGKGLMTNALKHFILPYLLGRRLEQKITFKAEYAHYFKKLGFRLISKESGVITRANIGAFVVPEPKPSRIDEARIALMKERLLQAKAFVGMCLDELRATGKTIQEDLQAIEDRLGDASCDVDALRWEL